MIMAPTGNTISPQDAPGSTDFNDSDIETKKNIIRLVSIQKIEEFVKLTDNTIDTSDLETLDFIPTSFYRKLCMGRFR